MVWKPVFFEAEIDMAKYPLVNSEIPEPGGVPADASFPVAARTNVKAQDKKRGSKIDLSEVVFNPKAKELQVTWSTYAKTIYCLNSYPNGITFSIHANSPVSFVDGGAGGQTSDEIVSPYLPHQFHLRFRDTKDYQLAPGKYFLHREDYAEALEHRLSLLHKQGYLESSVFYFGVTSDPFLTFQKKFDVTVTCLELFEHYRPGLVVVQTRSPMVIAALPMLKALGERAVVGIPIESPLESAIARFSPGQPKISERLIAADGLRRQGVRVNLIASPVLPYGEFYRDAWDFAELLEKHADFVSFGCLASGSSADESQLRTLPVAHKLVSDKQFRWLRPYSHRYLFYALSVIAPEKLMLPVKPPVNPSQLSLFAAA